MAEKNDEVPGFQNPVINTEQAQVLIDEMSDLLEINCDMAKSYFFPTHDDFPKHFSSQDHDPPFLEF